MPRLRISDSDTASAESDSSSASDEPGVVSVDLTLERLQSLQYRTSLTDDQSSYAITGGSKERVIDAWGHPCCKCRCRVPFGILFKIVATFWLLSKPTQDALLWSLQHEAGPKRKKWFIAGTVPSKNVCTMTLKYFFGGGVVLCSKLCQNTLVNTYAGLSYPLP